MEERIVLWGANAAAAGSLIKVESKKYGKEGMTVVTVDQLAAQDWADVVFRFKIKKAGRYLITSYADTRGEARRKMNVSHSKYDSLRIMLAVDDGVARSRVIVSPWQDQDCARQELERCELSAGSHVLRIRLPGEVGLNRLEIEPYLAPAVPPRAVDYRPAITPHAAHPRIWVTPESLPLVRANLNQKENRSVWEEIRQGAERELAFAPPPQGVVGYLPELLELAVRQAFVRLMTGENEPGRRAVRLMTDYLAAVEFDNLLDITRELGEVIYAGARVYDWCFELMTPDERSLFRRKLLRLADAMEIGWPPFGQPVVNGHGNEAQVCRDLLAMAIALYGENDQPYRYCAYLMFEELIPLRNLEYRCDRHNQGVGYGAYRFAFEMHAAWMLRRMCGHEVFDPVIKNVYNFWFNYRDPDGRMIQDGDGISGDGAWRAPMLSFLCWTYAGNPLIKGDFLAHGGAIGDQTLFLALNDPGLEAVRSLESLPGTHFFDGLIGSMTARTGWGPDAVVAEMKGGGCHFGNHQHADAGNFQLFYRGRLATDLGMYVFYGTPYDFGYNKRSICHNVMLAYDPAETFSRGVINDGGQRFNQELPLTPEMALHDPWFRNGATLAADFGPDLQWPRFSFLKADLRAAYSGKLKRYTRAFCFLRLDDPELPAALIVIDRVVAAKPEFQKYWLFNSIRQPEPTPEGLTVLSDREEAPAGKLTLSMLLPRDWTLELAAGEKLHDIFGVRVESPKPESPESRGCRAMFSPKQPQISDVFVAAMLIGASSREAPPIPLTAGEDYCVLKLPGRIVVAGTRNVPFDGSIDFSVSPSEACLIAFDLLPGLWYLENGGTRRSFTVLPGKGTLIAELSPGDCRLTPDYRL